MGCQHKSQETARLRLILILRYIDRYRHTGIAVECQPGCDWSEWPRGSDHVTLIVLSRFVWLYLMSFFSNNCHFSRENTSLKPKNGYYMRKGCAWSRKEVRDLRGNARLRRKHNFRVYLLEPGWLSAAICFCYLPSFLPRRQNWGSCSSCEYCDTRTARRPRQTLVWVLIKSARYFFCSVTGNLNMRRLGLNPTSQQIIRRMVWTMDFYCKFESYQEAVLTRETRGW